MTAAQAAILGLIQGITEFLPISSSGHLILASRLFGWPDQGLLFDTAAHSGSLVAVLVYFRRDLRRLLAGWARAAGGAGTDPPAGSARPSAASPRLARQLLIATVPVAVGGLLAADLLARGARGTLLIAATTVLFGLAMGWADRRVTADRSIEELTTTQVLGVGLAQALALVPGTSRSGVTITAGLLAGLSREDAARFSFLLAVPVGLLVALKDLWELAAGGFANGDGLAAAVGFLVSGLSAYAAIGWLLGWVRRQRLTLFVVYRVVLGLALLAAL